MAKFLNGVKLPHRKDTQGLETVVMPIPDLVSILMSQHIGATCEPTVKKGDTVFVGTLLGDSDAKISAPIHSSVSGTVKAIEEVLMPNGKRVASVVIETDKEQTLDESLEIPEVHSHQDFVNAIRNSGIVGLGGAGFPTHVKLNPPELEKIHTIIVNAAECEPFITSDNQTILEEMDNLLFGLENVKKFLDVSKVVFAIEDNKPEAIARLKESTKDLVGVNVHVLPAIYPQGSEKVTIYHVLDGLVVPEGQLPHNVGIIVLNVTTMTEIGRYLKDGIPLISKRVTVDGSAVAHPQNVRAPIGTSMKDIFEFSGGYKGTPAKITMGGPMMGIAVPSDEFPLIKNNNAIIAYNRADTTRYVETPCISCGRCLRACPMNLMPSNMKFATGHKNIDQLKELKVNVCMECGCCSFVCPARLELVQSHRQGKQLLEKDALDAIKE